MHKIALYLLKNCKYRPALGASPSYLLASGGWGALRIPGYATGMEICQKVHLLCRSENPIKSLKNRNWKTK